MAVNKTLHPGFAYCNVEKIGDFFMFAQDNIDFMCPVSVMFEADEKFSFAREPVLRRMPDGTLVSLLYTGGNKEPHPENVVAVTRSYDDGETWSKPEIIFQHPFRACWGTELFTGGDLPFIVFQTFSVDTDYCELRAFISFTRDNGKTWSEPCTIQGVPPNFTVRQGRILSDGSWIFPIYHQETNSQWQGSLMKDISCRKKWRFVCGVIKSTDGGKTFSYHGYIHHPADCHHWEPDITELENGHLLMYIRCESPENVLWQSESFDYGKTWSNSVPTDIPSAGSKEMICDIEGRKVMFFNHVTPDAVNRNTLAAWTSSDNCKTWYRKNVIAKLNDYTGELEEMYKGKIHPVQVAYPHVFADNEKRLVYLAIDSVYKFYLLKIPFDELI